MCAIIGGGGGPRLVCVLVYIPHTLVATEAGEVVGKGRGDERVGVRGGGVAGCEV